MKKQRKKMPRGARKQAQRGQTGPGVQKPIALRGVKDQNGDTFVAIQLGNEMGLVPVDIAHQLYEAFGKILDELKGL